MLFVIERHPPIRELLLLPIDLVLLRLELPLLFGDRLFALVKLSLSRVPCRLAFLLRLLPPIDLLRELFPFVVELVSLLVEIAPLLGELIALVIELLPTLFDRGPLLFESLAERLELSESLVEHGAIVLEPRALFTQFVACAVELIAKLLALFVERGPFAPDRFFTLRELGALPFHFLLRFVELTRAIVEADRLLVVLLLHPPKLLEPLFDVSEDVPHGVAGGGLRSRW
jgi:hypothetical protein